MNQQLNKQEIDILVQIKFRKGRREFTKSIVEKLIKLGLAAGDYSRAYITDAGDDLLQKLIEV